MNKSKIEWTDYTWNPITGCLNRCEYCYARRLASGRLKERYLANNNLVPTVGDGPIPYNTSRLLDSIDPFHPRFWPERLGEPCDIKKPAKIFTVDMGEMFGDWIPDMWIDQIFTTIKVCPHHAFQLLTKQPQNLIRWSPFPENCWVGVTATNTEMAAEAGFWLRDVKATVKFVSFEPLLERTPVHFPDFISDDVKGIGWVIIGSCTGTMVEMAWLGGKYLDLTLMPYNNRWTAQPKIEWVQEIVEAADKAGVPVFLKDNLTDLIPVNSPLRYGPAGELRLRQEFPKGGSNA